MLYILYMFVAANIQTFHDTKKYFNMFLTILTYIKARDDHLCDRLRYSFNSLVDELRML